MDRLTGQRSRGIGAAPAPPGGAGSALLLFGAGSESSTTLDRFLFPGYDGTTASTTEIQVVVPFPGTLRNLRLLHNGTAGNGATIVYTVRINGVDTAITANLASTGTQAADLTNTAAVAAGDLVSVIVTKAVSIGSSPSDIYATLELAQ